MNLSNPVGLVKASSLASRRSTRGGSARRFLIVSLAIVAGLFSLLTTQATATPLTPLAGISGGDPIGAWDNSTLGWDFVTGDTPIGVTHLGIFDSADNGLSAAHQVALWRAGDSALLTSTTVPGGTSAMLIDGFRYAPTTPVTLAPNTRYVLGAHYATGNDSLLDSAAVTMSFGATFGRAKSTGGPATGFAMPTINNNPTFDEAFFGPNLIAVPEPTTIGLAALALLGIGPCRRRHV